MIRKFISYFVTPSFVIQDMIVNCDDPYADITGVLTFEPFLHWLSQKAIDVINVKIVRFRLHEKVMIVHYDSTEQLSNIATLRNPEKIILLWCNCENQIFVLLHKLGAPTFEDIDCIRDIFYSEDGLIPIGKIETPTNRSFLFAHHSPSILTCESSSVHVLPLDRAPIHDLRMATLILLAKRQGVFHQNDAD